MPSWRMPPLNILVSVVVSWRRKAALSGIFLAGILPLTPEDNFVLCPEDYAAAEDWGTVIGYCAQPP
jgi:hypothetical protein